MSDSLTVLVYSLLVSVYVRQSHCVSLCLVSFSLCRTVSLSLCVHCVGLCLIVSVYVVQSHCVLVYALFQSMSDSLTLVYALLVSVYVGQSLCSFQSMSDSLTVLVYALLV